MRRVVLACVLVAVMSALAPAADADAGGGGGGGGRRSEAAPAFDDVGATHPFADAIGWLVAEGITTGYGDGTFRPGAPISRQAMAAFLHRFAQSTWSERTATFVDVKVDHAFAAEVSWLVYRGVTTGYDDGTFRPTAPISRQAMAAFLYRFNADGLEADPPGFTDVSAGHPFATEIGWLVERGVTTGYDDGTFRPTAPISRQAMAAFLWRLAGEPAAEEAGLNRLRSDVTRVPLDDVFEVAEPAWVDEPSVRDRFADGFDHLDVPGGMASGTDLEADAFDPGTRTVTFTAGAPLPLVGDVVFIEPSPAARDGAAGRVVAVDGTDVELGPVRVDELAEEGAIEGVGTVEYSVADLEDLIDVDDVADLAAREGLEPPGDRSLTTWIAALCGVTGTVGLELLPTFDVEVSMSMLWNRSGFQNLALDAEITAQVGATLAATGGVSCRREFSLPFRQIPLRIPAGPLGFFTGAIDFPGQIDLDAGLGASITGSLGRVVTIGMDCTTDGCTSRATDTALDTFVARPAEWARGALRVDVGARVTLAWLGWLGAYTQGSIIGEFAVTPLAETAIRGAIRNEVHGGARLDLWFLGQRRWPLLRQSFGVRTVLDITRPQIPEPDLADIEPDVLYDQPIPATGGLPYPPPIGGTPPRPAYDYEIVEGALPPGIELNALGRLAGAMPAEHANAGPWTFTVRITDAIGLARERALTIHPASVGPTATVLAAGDRHTCGLRADGTAVCWGSDDDGRSSPPAGTFTHLAAGDAHTCGLRTDGTANCWGYDASGQASPPTGEFTQLTAGNAHTCGLRTDGTAVCWGDDSFGQASPPTGNFTQLAAASVHTCGLRTDGTAVCWGTGTGDGQTSPPAGRFTHLAAGMLHTCGLRSDGTAVCWGNDDVGQLSVPPGAITQLAAGESHTCGRRSDGTAVCWGNDDTGQSSPPTGTFTQLAAGFHHTCGLRSDGTVTCWGNDSYGQSSPPAGVLATPSPP